MRRLSLFMIVSTLLVCSCGDSSPGDHAVGDRESAGASQSANTGAPRRATRFRPTIENDGWVASDSGFFCRAPVDAAAADRALSALGYAGGFEAPQAESGVTLFDPGRTQPGLNLVTSGHAPAASLMASDGTVLHRWGRAYADLPGARTNPPRDAAGSWRKTQLLEDGALLAIHEGLGLVCLEPDSSVRWFLPRRAHHDLAVRADGSILVLIAEPTRIPDLSDTAILEDRVLEVSKAGVTGPSVSLLEAFLRSPFEKVVRGRAIAGGDVMHANALSVLTDAQARAFAGAHAGDWLVSLRELDLVAVVDPTVPTVLWASQGPWRAQHDPSILANGRVLVFDNSGAAGYSRLVELDPQTKSIAWSWQDKSPAAFFSVLCGAAQRLANGNTLVTETCHGRAFELAPSGERVWSFSNPERAGVDLEFIAALFEVERLDPQLGVSWLASPKTAGPQR